MNTIPGGRGLASCVAFSRLWRAGWMAATCALMWLGLTSFAHAGSFNDCQLVIVGSQEGDGAPGDTVQFQFQVAGSSGCSASLAMNGGISITSDPTGSASLTDQTWSGFLGSTISFAVDLGPNGGHADIEVTCDSCLDSTQVLAYETDTLASVYDLTQLSPPDNTVAHQGDVLDLDIRLTQGGDQIDGAPIEWHIVGNPNNSTFGAPSPGSTLLTNQTVSGQASVQLNIGGPNPASSMITVRATAFPGTPQEVSTDFIILGEDTVTLTRASPASENQQAAVGDPLPVALTVQVTRNGSTAASNEVIDWTVTPAGAATLSATSVSSNSDGTASITVISVNAGGPFTVTAIHADYPAASVDFHATGLAYDIVPAATNSGDGQNGAPGTTLPAPLRAQVTLNGAPQGDIPVQFTVLSGDATLTGTNPVQSGGTDGIASIDVLLGSTPGPVTIRAEIVGDSTNFTDFNVTVGTPSMPTLDKPATGSGDGQSTAVGTAFPLALKALARNSGAVVPNITVTWAVTSGSATVTPSSVTDSGGIATVTVTAGATSGPIVITATRADGVIASTTYSLTATAAGTSVMALVKPTTNSGDNQSAGLGAALPQPLTVIATNNGLPVSGVTVTWAVTDGNATLGSAQSVTDINGRASISARAGVTPGTSTVTATRADAPLATSTFVITAVGPPPLFFTLEKPANSGDGSSVAPGGTVTLVTRILVNTGLAPGRRVLYSVVSGDATLAPANMTADNQGLTRTTVTVGSSGGPIVIRATAADDQTVSILYTLNGAVAANVLSIVSGDGQTGAPGASLAPLVVQYSDGQRAIPNATVGWTILEGSATLGATTTRTDESGRTSIPVTLGSATGVVRVQASTRDASVVFTLMSSRGGSIVLRSVSGTGQSGAAGTLAAQPLVVEAVDGSGAVVSGQTVLWEIDSGSATLDAASTQTGSNGRSSNGLRFGATPGSIVIIAYLPDQRSSRVRFQLSAIAAQLVIVSGDAQSGPVGTALAQDFVVQVVVPGQTGTSLAGITVEWQVAQGGGTLSTVTAVTDADGRAHTRLTLGPQAGANEVIAQVPNGGNVHFVATGVQDSTLSIVSGSGQALPTRAASAPLVVQVRNGAGQPVAGVRVNFTATNANVEPVSALTGADGRASTVARIVLPGAATVTATLTGSSVSVTFAINGGVANIVGLTPPQQDVAEAIDIFCPRLAGMSSLTAEQADLRTRCLELVDNAGVNPAGVGNALEALRQDVAISQANAAYASVNSQFDNLKTRIAALRSGSSGMDLGGLAMANSSGTMPLSLLPADEGDAAGSAAAEQEIGGEFSRWGFFASGIVGRGSQDADSVQPEYDFDSSGLTAGVDYRLTDRVILGVSAGFNRQSTDLARDRGGIDTKGWSLSAYSTWYQQNDWYVDGVLTFGSNDYDLDRHIRYSLPNAGGGMTSIDQLARASTGGDQTSLAVSLGRDFQRGPWSLGPYLRGTWTQVDFDAYTERLDSTLPGAGLALAVDSRELESQTAVLGGKASYAMSRDWGILIPHVQLEWEHQFEDDPDSLVARFLYDPTQTLISTDGESLDTDYYNLGFGLSALFPGGKSAFLYYERLIGGSGLSQDNLSVGVRFEF